MSTSFTPIEELEMYCRFCGKITTCQLDRSIAENGRTVDKNSTFEYYCQKCTKTVCFTGTDLLEQNNEGSEEAAPRQYSPQEHFLIGEKIYHTAFDEEGKVVGKDNGSPNRIFVKFEKSGLKKLVQDL